MPDGTPSLADLAMDVVAACERCDRLVQRHPKTGAMMVGEDAYEAAMHAARTLASVVVDPNPLPVSLTRALEIVLSRIPMHDGAAYTLRSALRHEREKAAQMEKQDGR